MPHSSRAVVSLLARAAVAIVLLVAAVFAQKPPAAPASGTQILFLGTAGGPPLRLNRSEPSTLLVVDGRSYLIDCGIGTMQRMLQAGVPSEQIKTIFFTHLHSDHDLGLADVMGNDYFRLNLSGSKESINIYGPPQTKELVDAAFHYIAVSVRPFVAQNPAGYRMVNGDLVNPFAVHEFDHDGVIFQDDKVRVVAAENTHYSFLAPQDRAQIKSYSYRFETPHGVVVFTGDTGPSDAVARLAKGADVLVAEVTNRNAEEVDRLVNSMAAENHWPPARVRAFRAHMQMQHLDTNTVGQLAGQAKVKAVVLYHYVPRDKADAEGYVAEVRKSFSGPVFAPADLDRYCLQAKAGGSQPAAPLSACGKP